ncbi:hypothetical protein F2Q70_00030390 [Brassica cretica]|uniref:Uncharacterized protein n=1 Tax=Brassica cretica TaxID=69181 RepID=A0A8S9FFH9_BRACR|nr:hypothetical protein F2Q70_00030390 [Brassica cretica]
MDIVRGWLNKLKSKGKDKFSKKKETTTSNNVNEGSRTAGGEEAVSNVTKQKAAAAKQFIENHYKKQVQSQQQRQERRNMLENKLAAAEVVDIRTNRYNTRGHWHRMRTPVKQGKKKNSWRQGRELDGTILRCVQSSSMTNHREVKAAAPASSSSPFPGKPLSVSQSLG